MEKNKETSVEAANLRRRANAAFSNSQEHHKLLLDGIPGIVYSFSNKRGGLYYSSYVNKLLGYSPEQLYSQPLLWHNSIHPDDVLQVDQTICETTADKAFCIEYRIKDAQGDWHWFDDRSFGYRIDGEEVIIEGIAVDITERKQAEEALQENELQHRKILQAAMDGFWLADLQGHLLEVNETYCRMSGYGALELLAMRISDFEANETTDATASHMRKIISQGEDRFETRHRRKDGTIYDVEINVQYRSIDGGKFVAFIHDISERKQAEEAQKQSHNMVVNLTSQVPGVVYQYLLHPDGRSSFPFSSPGMNDIYEVTPEDVREDATVVFGRLHPDDHDRVAASIMESADTLQMFYCEFRVILPRQGLRWRWSQARPERTEDGGTLWYGIISDITDRKLVEEALRESEERVQKKLLSILSPEEDLGELELEDIIDVKAIQHLMDEFYKLTLVPNSIIDLKGKVLVGTGWQDICTNFHRMHPETLNNCIECDTMLSKDVEPGTFRTYLCKNNLWDCVTPLIVGGQHIGNLFTGQFFFEGEKPNDSVFLAQAAKYGFDEEEYMAAVRRVPVWDRETINAAFEFYITLAGMITSLSHGNITLAKMLEERKRVEEEKRQFYRDTINSVTQGKLDLVSLEEVKDYLDPAGLILNVDSPADCATARSKIVDFCISCGLVVDRLGLFESAVGEAITNAIIHADRCQVHAGVGVESIWVAISDTGQGISTMLLPGATLRRGFSSKVSMGMGYTIMMDATDNIMLCTGLKGTTVVLSVNLNSSKPAMSLDNFPDTWDEIADF